MRLAHHCLRLNWLALVALLGLVSWASEASAGMGSSAGSSCACCSRPDASRCGCCKPGPSQARPVRTGKHLMISVSGPGRVERAAPCPCVSDEPTAPIAKPESRSSLERRPAPLHAGTAERDRLNHFRVTFTHLATPFSLPPKIPLYLRNERLLI